MKHDKGTAGCSFRQIQRNGIKLYGTAHDNSTFAVVCFRVDYGKTGIFCLNFGFIERTQIVLGTLIVPAAFAIIADIIGKTHIGDTADVQRSAFYSLQ